MSTFCANKFGEGLAHLLCNTHTLPMEPVVTQVTAHIKPVTHTHITNHKQNITLSKLTDTLSYSCGWHQEIVLRDIIRIVIALPDFLKYTAKL
jgi:hypothetical protein